MNPHDVAKESGINQVTGTKQANETFIIAEAGVNHNGHLSMACELASAAAAAGADAVKFQTFSAEDVVSSTAPKAPYQIDSTGYFESQLEMVKKLELSRKDHLALADHCERNNILFLSTPFDESGAAFLVHEIGVPILKISSGDITNAPFLLNIARLQKPIILSTGMCNLAEVKLALGVLAYGCGLSNELLPGISAFHSAFRIGIESGLIRNNITLLHCTTEYPAPINETNLRAMLTLAKTFGLRTGLSDHTDGITVPIAAAALGACVIEKHLTLNRSLPGPDHKASLEPAEFSKMVRGIREATAALGDGHKRPQGSEDKNILIARRSLVAKRNVSAGEKWDASNLCCKRPGSGLPPSAYWEIIGTIADKNYRKDEPLVMNRK
jgi:N-acetylneuraminate synthase